jgi:hypothetical protein
LAAVPADVKATVKMAAGCYAILKGEHSDPGK